MNLLAARVLDRDANNAERAELTRVHGLVQSGGFRPGCGGWHRYQLRGTESATLSGRRS